jgi:uncharacterized RDD family membrane protein YckC
LAHIFLSFIYTKPIPMNEQILDAPADVEKKLQYAGFWIRVAAYIIDAIILWLVNFAVSMVFLGGASAAMTMGANIPFVIVLSLAGVAYFIIMDSSSRQGTVGKMAVGIKIGKENGERISVVNALGRYLAKILSALILFIGFIMVGFDARKQGLHDKLAKTYVFYA